jgi:acyl-CoA synthetase (NDP forming)
VVAATPALTLSSISGEVASTPRQNLTPLLHAGSVAIVGLSQLPGFGGWIYTNLRDFGYAERGRIYGVNPRYSILYEQPCYPSLRDLPERPDCAILALPNHRLLPVLQEAAELQIPAAVIFASAYSDPVDSQPSLQASLAETARWSGMVVCGPNCMGFLAFGQKLVVSGYPVTPGTPGGGVTFITHSGSVFDTVWQNRRGVRFNYVISSGNEIATTMADYMQFALADPTTQAIALFLETVRDPATFVAALREAAERDIPVVALKVGRSAQGAQLAQAHSGALAGQDAAYEALFARYGVRRVKSLDEMMDALELFSTGLRTPTRYISSVHDSGGERGLLVDLAESEGVQFAPITAKTMARLASTLEPGLAPVNPVDAWGTGNDFGRIYRECLLALDADPATGLTVFGVDLYPAGSISRTYLDVALEVRPQLTKPLVFLSNLSSAVADDVGARLRQAGVPVLMGTENGLRAIRHLIEYSEYQRRRAVWEPEARAVVLHPTEIAGLHHELQRATGPLDEYASKKFLRAYGIPTPAEAIATSLKDALQVAEQIGYPVALKTGAGQLWHKSDRGGVRLNLRTAAELSEAYRDFETRFGPRVLVQEMAAEGAELILGLVNDPQFGLMLTIGMGGIFVEVMKDSRLLMLPTTRTEVRESLLSLRGAALLKGARGRASLDVEAIIDAALRLAALAADLGDLIAALDINPLIALPAGVVAVDALIVPQPATLCAKGVI